MSDDGRPTATEGYPTGYPWLFWVGLALGWVVIALALRGVLVHADSPMATNPRGWALLLAKSNVAHDFLLVPAVIAIGGLVGRVVPARVRAPVQAGLICSGVAILYAVPFVRRWGARPSNPTILPRDYGRGLLLVLVTIWVVAAALAVWRWRRAGGGSVAGEVREGAERVETAP